MLFEILHCYGRLKVHILLLSASKALAGTSHIRKMIVEDENEDEVESYVSLPGTAEPNPSCGSCLPCMGQNDQVCLVSCQEAGWNY